MAVYLVERYISLADADDADAFAAQLRAAVAAVQAEGVEVEWLGSVVLPGDETCLCLFEAPSESEVAAANARAGAEIDRVAAAALITPAG